MAYPAGLQTVTVTCGPYLTITGAPLAGRRICLTPQWQLIHEPTGTVLLPSGAVIELDADGKGSLPMPASDAAGLTRPGVRYLVSFDLGPGVPAPAPFLVLLPAAATVVDLDLLAPVTGPDGSVVSLPTVTSLAGISGPVSAGQVATALDSAGNRLSDAALRAAYGRRVVTNGAAFQATNKLEAANNVSIALAICGMDTVTPGRIYARDLTNGNFSQSDDWGVTWSHLRGRPAGTVASDGTEKIIRFGNYIWTVLKDATSGLHGIYRAPAGAAGTAYVWSAQLFTQRAGMHANVKSCFNAGSQYLFLGDYSGPGVDNPGVYRLSLSDANAAGSNWQTVWGPDAATHHVHAVTEDPYNPGHVYLSLGDNSAPACIYRSTQHGAPGTFIAIIANTGTNDWQSVQMSFSPQWVWMASDHYGVSVIVFDRDQLVPYNAAQGVHANIPVPGGAGPRNVSDLATTAASTTVTSATANFTSADVGRFITSAPIAGNRSDGLPAQVYIVAVTNATTATISTAAALTRTAQPARIDGERFYTLGYFGMCDPGSESFYWVAHDTSAAGTTQGLFYLPFVGATPQLLESRPVNGVGEFFRGNGYLWTGARYFKPLVTAAL